MPAAVVDALTILFVLALFAALLVVARAVRDHLSAGSARSGLSLVVVDASAKRSVPLTGSIVIGRAADADLVIDDPYASDRHARFGIREGEVRLRDLDSTNGTWVNGERIEAARTVHHGDEIKIGNTTVRLG